VHSECNRLRARINPELDARLDANVRKCLEAKGLALVASGRSDLNIRYTLGAVRKTEVKA
jgi:hypothetical protein